MLICTTINTQKSILQNDTTPALICIAAAVEKIMLPVDPNLEMEKNVYERKLY